MICTAGISVITAVQKSKIIIFQLKKLLSLSMKELKYFHNYCAIFALAINNFV